MIYILASGLKVPYPAAGLLIPSGTNSTETMTSEQDHAMQQQVKVARA
ncbi:MAG: hypothetical protein HY619_05720 [Thaumarchaeota archaeon]|nr:hypothetical protein [Nitrososphaerota archaeon]